MFTISDRDIIIKGKKLKFYNEIGECTQSCPIPECKKIKYILSNRYSENELYLLDIHGYVWNFNLKYNSFKVLQLPFLVKNIFISKNYLYMIDMDSMLRKTNSNLQSCKYFPIISVSENKINEVSCGNNFMFIICENNSIWTFGDNQYGQLGLENQQNSKEFIELKSKILQNEIISSISCGENHSMFLSKSKNIYTCGRNSYGQLGVDNIEFSSELIFIEELLLICDISCQLDNSFCIDLYGNLFVFGKNFDSKPKKLQNIPKITAINYAFNSINTFLCDNTDTIWKISYDEPNNYKIDQFQKSYPTYTEEDCFLENVECLQLEYVSFYSYNC